MEVILLKEHESLGEIGDGEGEYVFAENKTKEIVLIKPSTGMNNSGIIIKSLVLHLLLFLQE